jgi:hypothetical protein
VPRRKALDKRRASQRGTNSRIATSPLSKPALAAPPGQVGVPQQGQTDPPASRANKPPHQAKNLKNALSSLEDIHSLLRGATLGPSWPVWRTWLLAAAPLKLRLAVGAVQHLIDLRFQDPSQEVQRRRLVGVEDGLLDVLNVPLRQTDGDFSGWHLCSYVCLIDPPSFVS